jgi:sulfur carrier protein ThiS
MKVYVESRDFKKTVDFKGGTAGELLKQMKLSSENYVITKNNEIVLESEKLKDKDRVKLFPVISGG